MRNTPTRQHCLVTLVHYRCSTLERGFYRFTGFCDVGYVALSTIGMAKLFIITSRGKWLPFYKCDSEYYPSCNGGHANSRTKWLTSYFETSRNPLSQTWLHFSMNFRTRGNLASMKTAETVLTPKPGEQPHVDHVAHYLWHRAWASCWRTSFSPGSTVTSKSTTCSLTPCCGSDSSPLLRTQC